MSITKLIIKDVRCFAGEQKFNIRPMTFLVGENSTGKSTALACMQILHSATSLRARVGLDFNAEPYLMGTFSDIVRKSRPKNNSFEIGIEIEDENNKTTKYTLTLAEKDEGTEPIIQQIQVLFQDGNEVVIKQQKNENQTGQSKVTIEARLQKQGKKLFDYAEESLETNDPVWLLYVAQQQMKSLAAGKAYYLAHAQKKIINSFLPERKDIARKLYNFTGYINRIRVDSFAPIRSKPKRTYDPVKAEAEPEGTEMPMRLDNISGSKQLQTKWDELKENLIEFGKLSGLYKDISIRKLGRTKNDPFQIQIKVRGPKVNLMDVGYGISQILPILVRIFLSRNPTTFLIQQPEVHLHPQAQAELSSLLISVHKTMKHHFVIETHSDYMVDRVRIMVDRTRIEIRKGNIKPEDVSLIYLEPVGNWVKAHNIEFDKNANVLNAPQGYREFFDKELDRILGFT